jgi:hypothetical protein
MTRQTLLTLMAAAPVLFFGRRDGSKINGGDVVQFMPGTYTIAAGGGIYVSEGGVRIEKCTFNPGRQAD